MSTVGGNPLYGDWRASAYGAARRVHLFVIRFGETRKVAACGARIDRAKTGSVSKRALRDICYDCLAYGAAGR